MKPPFIEEGLTVRKLRPLLLLPLVLAAVLLPSSGHAADPVLMAKVGPDQPTDDVALLVVRRSGAP